MKTYLILLLTLIPFASFSQTQTVNYEDEIKIQLTKNILVVDDLCNIYLKSPDLSTRRSIEKSCQDILFMQSNLTLSKEMKDWITSSVGLYQKVVKINSYSDNKETAMCALGLNFTEKMIKKYIPKMFCN